MAVAQGHSRLVVLEILAEGVAEPPHPADVVPHRSVVPFDVRRRRTREIGIRIALGARRTDVVRMVLLEGLSLTLIGSAIGLILAGATSHILEAFLFGIPPIDPLTFAGTTLLFAAIGVAACYAPVRRAMHIDAMEALRYE